MPKTQAQAQETLPSVSYAIEDMRVILPSEKVAERNPDRLFTVHGKFRHLKDGSPVGDVLTFPQKEVTREQRASAVFAITIDEDSRTGTLTLPTGERGRKAAEGISLDALNALLAETAQQ